MPTCRRRRRKLWVETENVETRNQKLQIHFISHCDIYLHVVRCAYIHVYTYVYIYICIYVYIYICIPGTK
jgi:hypothetical protein